MRSSARALLIAAAVVCFASMTLAATRCVFLHGAGQREFQPTTSTFEDYWGDVHEWTKHCSSHTFNHHNTVQNAWFSDLLAKDYCRIAAGKAPLGEAGANAALIEVEEEARSESESEEEERSQVQVQAPLEIEDDVIIFTHSAANLILATGIKKGYCKLGDKARWYDVAGPARGSPVANRVNQICNNPKPLETLLVPVLKSINHCKSNDWKKNAPNNLNAMTNSLRVDHVMFNEIRPDLVLGSLVKGNLCGYSAKGMGLEKSKGLQTTEALGAMGDYDNDGLVSMDSCIVGDEDKYCSSPSCAFYKAKLNHVDVTCKNGDDAKDKEQQACKWFASRK